MRISFAVVPETLFKKLFARHRTATFGDIGSPKTYPPLEGLSAERNSVRARLTVPTSACRGHFEQHPALPVTVLVGELVRMARSLLAGKYRVTNLRVRSPALAWAGDQLSLELTRGSGASAFIGRAHVADRLIANVQFSVAPNPGSES